MANTTSDKALKVIVVTPERQVLEASASYVTLPMFDGELGVQAGRSAFVGQLGAGELRLTIDGKTQSFFIDGGFAQVRSNIVNVLTPKALAAEKVTAEAIQAEEAKAAALPSSNDVEKATKQRAADRIQGMTRLKAKLSK